MRQASLRDARPSGVQCCGLLFGVAGDDLILDLVVSGLWEDTSGNKLILSGIGASVDDSLGVGVTDSGECLELVGRGGVDVQGR